MVAAGQGGRVDLDLVEAHVAGEGGRRCMDEEGRLKVLLLGVMMPPELTVMFELPIR